MKTGPLIEIVGPPDCGKRLVGAQIARKLGGRFFSFPTLNVLSATGGALLSLLVNHPQELESNPEWWSHIYAANLFEMRGQLLDALNQGPVVVTNYIQGFKIWAEVAREEDKRTLWGYTTGLPAPNTVLHLWGDTWESPGNFKVHLSQSLQMRLRSAYQRSAVHQKFTLLWEEEKYRHLVLNKCVTAMCNHLKTKYPTLEINPFIQFAYTDFMKKRDQ